MAFFGGMLISDEISEYDFDVEAIRQTISDTGYLASCGSVFEDKYDWLTTVAPRSARPIRDKVITKPKPSSKVEIKNPVIDFVAYKARRLIEQQAIEDAEKLAVENAQIAQAEKQAQQAIAERRVFIHREMMLNDNLPGRRWAQSEILKTFLEIKELRKLKQLLEVKAYKKYIKDLRHEYQISA